MYSVVHQFSSFVDTTLTTIYQHQLRRWKKTDPLLKSTLILPNVLGRDSLITIFGGMKCYKPTLAFSSVNFASVSNCETILTDSLRPGKVEGNEAMQLVRSRFGTAAVGSSTVAIKGLLLCVEGRRRANDAIAKCERQKVPFCFQNPIKSSDRLSCV